MAEPWLELLRTIDDVPVPAGLKQDIARRRLSVESHRGATGSSSSRARRAGATVAVIGVAAAVLVLLALAAHSRRNHAPAPATDPWSRYTGEWSKLPSPPQGRTGAALVWTGHELLSLGGAVPGVGPAARDGYAFDPRTGSWSHLPPAPGAGRTDARAFWTGREVLLVGGAGDAGQTPHLLVAFDPSTRSWRAIPDPPPALARDAASVWTGRSLIMWGGGRPGSSTNRTGAAYTPTTGRWHLIARAPIGLNSATAVWTGSQVIVFGALLDHDNTAATRTALGATYDPGSDTWQRIRPSALAPQATSAAWLGERLFAWDYTGHSQQYTPATGRWSAAGPTPFGPGECQPQTVATRVGLFAFFCGRAATVSPSQGRWVPVSGGLTSPTLDVGVQRLARYQMASLAAAGAVVAIAATGIVNDHGTPCFGCRGAQVSYWLYRPYA
jgi:hypothetical protein